MELSAEALTEYQLGAVHEKTVKLLAEHGIQMKHNKTCQFLKECGAEIKEDNIVKIPPKLIEDALQKAPESFSVTSRNPDQTIEIGKDSPSVLAPAAGVVNVSSYEEGRRPAMLEDLRNFLALSQSSKYIDVSTAGLVYPEDIDSRQELMLQMLEAIKLSDKPVIGLTQNKQIAEDSIAMARAAVEEVEAEHYVIGIVNSLSPMAWDENMLEAIWAYADKNQPLVITSCSMAGFTSPVKLIPTVIQTNAEILAGVVLAQLINPGTPVVYGNTSTITDMMTMNLSIGAPEYVLLSTACKELARDYNLPFRSGGGLTDAKAVDMQAGVEAGMNLIFSEINNTDFMLHTIGIMESFAAINYEKWILDEEIWARIVRINQGIGQLEKDDLEVITSIKPGTTDSFINHPQTINKFKDEFFRPPLSDKGSWEEWQKKEETAHQKAQKIWKERLAEFEPPPLSEPLLKELKRICK